MKQAVDVIGRLSRDDVYTPIEMISSLSSALEKSPQIQLLEIKLKYDLGINDNEIFDPLAGQVGDPLIDPMADPIAMDPKAAATPKPIIEIQAKLMGVDNNFRESLIIVNGFVDRLQNNRKIQKVNLTTPPVNLEPTAQLSGNTGVSEKTTGGKSEHSSFSVEIIFHKSKKTLPLTNSSTQPNTTQIHPTNISSGRTDP